MVLTNSCFTSAFLSAKPSLALASSSILNYLGTEDEVWWHLPLLALGLGALGVCGGLVFFWNRSRKAKTKNDRTNPGGSLHGTLGCLAADCHQFRGSSFLMFPGYLRLIKYGCVALSMLKIKKMKLRHFEAEQFPQRCESIASPEHHMPR